MGEEKHYGFIRYETRVIRKFYKGISKESVGNWIRDLEHEQKELKNLSWTARESLGASKERIEELQDAVDKEMKLARFYLDYFKHTKEQNFNEWVLSKDEEEGYNRKENKRCKYSVDKWAKRNGRIGVVIKIIPPNAWTHSTRVSLSIFNDNSIFVFYEKGGEKYPEELSYTNLRNSESITEQVATYKKEAEDLFNQYSYPTYFRDAKKMEELNTLLHIKQNKK
jgi:hypothetical protein